MDTHLCMYEQILVNGWMDTLDRWMDRWTPIHACIDKWMVGGHTPVDENTRYH